MFRIAAILLWAAPTSQLVYIVFAILAVDNLSSLCTRAGSWSVRRVGGPAPLRADSRWRYSLWATWPLSLAVPFLQNILLLLLPPSAKIFLGFGAFAKVEPVLCQWWVFHGPGSWQK